jgi:hypothetical protein
MRETCAVIDEGTRAQQIVSDLIKSTSAAILKRPEESDALTQQAGLGVSEIAQGLWRTLGDTHGDGVRVRVDETGEGDYTSFLVDFRTGRVWYNGAPRPATEEHASRIWFAYGEPILSGWTRSRNGGHTPTLEIRNPGACVSQARIAA